MSQGFFLTLEGIEGAGKSTVAAEISRWLDTRGTVHLCTREPGGTAGGEAIRDVLLGTDIPLYPETELFLIEAARAQIMREVILPALTDGKTVVLDRHTDSTLAYQGYGRGLSFDQIHTLNRIATEGREPDCTLILDLDVETGLARSRKVSAKPDRFESETVEFMEKVRDGFLDLAKKNSVRYKVIRADQAIEHVMAEVIKALHERIAYLL